MISGLWPVPFKCPTTSYTVKWFVKFCFCFASVFIVVVVVVIIIIIIIIINFNFYIVLLGIIDIIITQVNVRRNFLENNVWEFQDIFYTSQA